MSATKNATKAGAKPADNGQPPDQLADAMAGEAAIAVEAAVIRGDATELDAALFLKLWPLLRRPIPQGFITTTEPTKGKPYPSTGIKSVQVCVDRMDAVLTPLWWWESVNFEDEGKRALVAIFVGSDRERPLVIRRSQGGVNQASTIGNLYKGSYTNAAKRAFAMLGVGHEVYLGAADFDPDTDPDAAKAQEGASPAGPERLSPERAENLAAIVESVGLADHLPAKLRSFGKKSIGELSLDQAMSLYEWTQEAGEAQNG